MRPSWSSWSNIRSGSCRSRIRVVRFCVFGVGEAVYLGHVEGATANLCGHVEDTAAADCGELRTVAYECDCCTCFCRDGEQCEGCLVEHPGLIDHNPIPTPQHGTGQRARERHSRGWINLSRREACPYAVIVPPVAVRMHERGNRRGRHTKLLPRDIGGALGRRNDADAPTV